MLEAVEWLEQDYDKADAYAGGWTMPGSRTDKFYSIKDHWCPGCVRPPRGGHQILPAVLYLSDTDYRPFGCGPPLIKDHYRRSCP